MDRTCDDACAAFTRQPRFGFHDPVTAAIPSLVMLGAFDTRTAPSRGATMVASLPKGRLAVLPQTGHGALARLQCESDIPAPYPETSIAPFDASCAQAPAPAFPLPDWTRSKWN